MRKYTSIPAVTGNQLIKLLEKDGWIVGRRTRHAISLTKKINSHTLVTIVKDTSESLPPKTLGLILGPKQTKIGTKGLLSLLNKYGL